MCVQPIKPSGDECLGRQHAIVLCQLGTLIVWVIIDKTKNLNRQQSETIGCEEANKMRGFHL